jgi:hypothetical protein
MALTKAQIEKIVTQVKDTPDREIILPKRYAWKDREQPYIYVDSRPMPLVRYLWCVIIGPCPIPDGMKLRPKVGTSRANVNPYLWEIVPQVKPKPIGPRRNTLADINRAKTTCPKGHELVRRKSGKRLCLECPRESKRQYRERQKRES